MNTKAKPFKQKVFLSE